MSEVMCRDTATRHVKPISPYLYQLCDSPTSKHIPIKLGTIEKEKKRKGVPTFPVSTNLKSWECAGKPGDVQAIRSPKRPEDGDVESETVSVWTVRPSCVNLRYWGSLEKSGWRVCNTDHTGSKWRASAPAENPAIPCMCCEWKTCFTGESEISPCLRPCQFGFMSLEGADSVFHCVINDVLHLEKAISTVSSWQPHTVFCQWKCMFYMDSKPTG